MDLAEAAAACEHQDIGPVNLLLLAEAAATIDERDRVAIR